MKIIVGVSHPKHVHFSKNIINELVNKGHEVKIVVWDKDITLYLLEAYGFDYEVIGINQKTLTKKAYGLIKSDFNALKTARKFKPDILVGGSPYLAHVASLIGKPHIGFTDTENANLANWLFFPFSDAICTPSCYKGIIPSRKHIPYNGFEELAYLHPNYFKPDPLVLDYLGLDKSDSYVIVRFVAWKASHDRGDKGFIDKVKLIRSLEKYSQVFITSEAKLPDIFERYRINIPPEKIHHVMNYARLYIGESASMACESAILGTPAIFVSKSRRGYTDELESKYDLLYSFSDPKNNQQNALDKARQLLNDENTKKNWLKKKDKLLKDKIDVTKFITEFIEKYLNNKLNK